MRSSSNAWSPQHVRQLLQVTLAILLLWSGEFRSVQAAVDIRGRGASFPAILYGEWTRTFNSLQSTVKEFNKVTYVATSSRIGKDTAVSRDSGYSFGASDIVFPDTNQEEIAIVPVVAGVPEANSTALVLTRQNVVDIFSGVITAWNDSRLTVQNPVLTSVPNPIKIVVRQPGSGTTYNLFKALGSFDPSFRPRERLAGTEDEFSWLPSKVRVSTAQDVATFLRYDDYVLGYIDLRDTSGDITYATLVNKAGRPVRPTLEAVKAAMMAARTPDNVTISALGFNPDIFDSDASEAYPICAYTYYYIRKKAFRLPTEDEGSDPVLTIRWTLRYLFWTLTSGTPDSVADYKDDREYRPSLLEPTINVPTALKLTLDSGFVPLTDVIRTRALSILTSITLDSGLRLFGESPCDFRRGTPNACEPPSRCRAVDGFQESSKACLCRPPKANIFGKRCTEDANLLLLRSSRLVPVSLVLNVIGMVFVVGTTIMVVLNRRHPNIKSIAPVCCFVILGGCLVGLVGQTMYTIVPNDAVCKSRLFFPPLAFGIVFGMLFMKTYRIYVIFGYKQIAIEERTMPNNKLIFITGAIAAVEFILVLIWVLVTDPHADDAGLRDTVISSAYLPVCVPKDELKQKVFEVMLFALNGALCFATMYMAVRTRHAYERFRESKSIGMAVYTVTITLVIGLPILYFLPTDTEAFYDTSKFILTCVLFLCSTVTPGILFGPRLVEIISKSQDGTDDLRDPRLKHLGRSLQFETQERLNSSHSAAQMDDEISDATMRSFAIQAIMFEVGVRPLRFGSVWQSLVLLVIPELDILLLVDDIRTFKILSGMKLSFVTCEVAEPPSGSITARNDPPQQQEGAQLPTLARLGSFAVSRSPFMRGSEHHGSPTGAFGGLSPRGLGPNRSSPLALGPILSSPTRAAVSGDTPQPQPTSQLRFRHNSGLESTASETQLNTTATNATPDTAAPRYRIILRTYTKSPPPITANKPATPTSSPFWSAALHLHPSNASYLIEFSTETRAKEFQSIHDLVRKRAGVITDPVQMPSTPSFMTSASSSPSQVNEGGRHIRERIDMVDRSRRITGTTVWGMSEEADVVERVRTGLETNRTIFDLIASASRNPAASSSGAGEAGRSVPNPNPDSIAAAQNNNDRTDGQGTTKENADVQRFVGSGSDKGKQEADLPPPALDLAEGGDVRQEIERPEAVMEVEEESGGSMSDMRMTFTSVVANEVRAANASDGY